MKKMFWIVAALLWMVESSSSGMVPPPPLGWTQMSSRGSTAEEGRGGASARFVVRRVSHAPKTDVTSHGYAYLLSAPILLPREWSRIVLSGRWWYLPKGSNNYPEITMMVAGKYPATVHGLRNGGRELSDYLMVSYDTWHKQLKFADRGEGGRAVASRMSRRAPRQPVPFRIVISRDPGSKRVSWDFYEARGGNWRHLRHQANSQLFSGTGMDRVYWKIGAWSTWDKPVATEVRFDRLASRVYVGEQEQSGETVEEEGGGGTGSSGLILEKGSAHLLRNGHKIVIDARTRLEKGDLIEAGGGGEAWFRLGDGSIIRLGGGSRFRLDELYGQCGMGQICSGTLLEGTLRLLFHSGREGWWIRMGEALIRLADAELILRLLNGRREIGCLAGLIDIEIGGRRYELHGGEVLRFRNGRWELFPLETEGSDGVVSHSFSECMELVPIMPGATNAEKYVYGPNMSIVNNDTLHSYLIHAPVGEVEEYYRTHSPRGKGWRLDEKPNLLRWSNGIVQVVIGISPTGVDTITAIYFHYCGRDYRGSGKQDRYRDEGAYNGRQYGNERIDYRSGNPFGLPGGIGGPEMTSCLKMVPHPSGFVRLSGRSSMLKRKLAGNGWQEESYRGKENAVFVYNFFRQYLPRGVRHLESVEPDDTLHATLGWELPVGPDRILYRVWVVPDASGKSTIDIGCKWERGE